MAIRRTLRDQVPELPEVEVVRRGLERWVIGKEIAGVEVRHPRAVRRSERDLGSALPGRRFRCASRRGKYLWLPLEGEPACLVVHLGMSGQLLVQPSGSPDERHLHVRITFAGEESELRFVDQRTFGGLMIAESVPDGSGGQVPAPVAHIARDPLDPAFDDPDFSRRLRSRSTAVKRALLDQTLISGVGNIYADEALWRSGLHGRRPSDRLTKASVAALLGHIRAVMTEALAQGGTSFDALYVNVNGQSGYFDRSLAAYGQEGHPCSRCATAIRREAFMNRSSFFCPRCQRAPVHRKPLAAG
jgi:formamidopyrimidine-DNA glycosylase